MEGEKAYNDLNSYLRGRFGCKVYKLALSCATTCPNRDGTCGERGCIFCSEGGSGDFAAPIGKSIPQQLEWAKERLRPKLGSSFDNTRFIAYFQSYTGTYAPIEYLRECFYRAIEDTSVCVLSVATRPDCLNEEVMELLIELNRIKPVWIELGLQTIHEKSAEFIRRGYTLDVFENAVDKLAAAGIEIIVHVILGLPGESREQMLETVSYVGKCPVQGIKLQLLHIMSGTDLGDMYYRGLLNGELEPAISTPEEYISILADCIDILPPRIVIHRLTGDAPHDKLLYPLWSANKRTTLNGLQRELKLRKLKNQKQ